MESIVSDFLKELRIPVSPKYAEYLIHSHPDFPSLLSVSDTLTRLGVEHSARRINENDLFDLQYPFLLPLDKGRGDLLLIRSERDLGKYKDEMKLWGGVVLQAASARSINDQLNNEIFSKEKKIKTLAIGLSIIFASFVLFRFLNLFSWLSFSLLCTAVIGAATGYFLLAKELGVSYQTIDDFCNAGKNTNCDKVLKADISFLGIHFSDAVFSYFVFQVITISLFQGSAEFGSSCLQVLMVFSILSLPFVLFSLYYQKFVAKTWCKLCLIVASILLVQFVTFVAAYTSDLIGSFKTLLFLNVFSFTALFVAVGLSVILVKTIIERSQKFNRVEGSANRVKHSVEVFNYFLMKQKMIDTSPFELEMLLGSPTAPIKVVMVSNLYCNPCKEKHKVVEELISMYPNKVSVALRFVRSRPDTVGELNSGSYLLGAWLTHCAGREHESEMTGMLVHDWFEIWDLNEFSKKYHVDEHQLTLCKNLEETHHAWTQQAEVYLTPTFFVNGFQLPKEYSLDDMLSMVPSLIDETVDVNNGVLQNT